MTIKMVATGKRKAGTSLAEFDEHWKTRHAPLVKEVSEALHIRGYVQCLRMDAEEAAAFSAGRAGSDDVPDFVAEIFFDSAADMAAAFASPEGQVANARLQADEEKFLDRASIVCVLTEHHTQI